MSASSVPAPDMGGDVVTRRGRGFQSRSEARFGVGAAAAAEGGKPAHANGRRHASPRAQPARVVVIEGVDEDMRGEEAAPHGEDDLMLDERRRNGGGEHDVAGAASADRHGSRRSSGAPHTSGNGHAVEEVKASVQRAHRSAHYGDRRSRSPSGSRSPRRGSDSLRHRDRDHERGRDRDFERERGREQGRGRGRSRGGYGSRSRSRSRSTSEERYASRRSERYESARGARRERSPSERGATYSRREDVESGSARVLREYDAFCLSAFDDDASLRLKCRLYIGNLPALLDRRRAHTRELEDAVRDALNAEVARDLDVLQRVGTAHLTFPCSTTTVLQPGFTPPAGAHAELLAHVRATPVLRFQSQVGKNYGFADFRTPELATLCCALHGPQADAASNSLLPHDVSADVVAAVSPLPSQTICVYDTPLKIARPSEFETVSGAPPAASAYAQRGMVDNSGPITTSNFRKNASLISHQSSTAAVVTADMLAALRSRVASAQGGGAVTQPPPAAPLVSEANAVPVASSAAMDTTDASAARAAADLSTSTPVDAALPPAGVPAADAAQPPPLPPQPQSYSSDAQMHSGGVAGFNMPGSMPPHLPFDGSQASMQQYMALPAASASAASAPAAGMTGGMPFVPPRAGDATSTAAVAAATAAAMAAASGQPLLGHSSSVTSLPMPNNVGGMVSISSTPAGAAGMLGSAGMMGLLAAIKASRILVLHNMLSDADAASPPELADILADVAIEAARAAEGKGAVLRVCIPKPRAGESMDIKLTQSIRMRSTGMGELNGAMGLLEDARPADRSRKIASTIGEFFTKALGKGGALMGQPGGIGSITVGLLTNGPAGSTFGAAAASYSNFYAETAGNNEPAPGATGDGGGGEAPKAAGDAGSAADAEDTMDEDAILAKRTRGLGKIFVQFSTQEAAVACQHELSGRAFGGRIIVTSFADEDAFLAGSVCDFSACV